MPTIGSFSINITAFTAGLNKGLKRASSMLRSFGSAVVSGIGMLAKLGAAAGAAALGGITLLFNRHRQLIDQLAKTSDKLGIATEDLQALRHAAELSGVSSNTLDMALQRMTRRIAEAAMGTGEAKEALQELGLDAQKLATAGPAEAMRQIADAMQKIPNQSDRVRLAFKLFDSEGVALVNTLAGGSKALDAAREDIDKLGVGLSRVDAAQVEAANDALTRVGLAIKAVGQQITVALAPFVEAVAEKFVGLAESVGGFGQFATMAVEKATTSIAFLIDFISKATVAWDVFKFAIVAGIKIVIDSLNFLIKGFEKLLDLVGIEFTPDRALGKLSKDLDATLGVIADEINVKLDRDLAGEVTAFFDNIKAKSRKTAEEVAAVASQNIGGTKKQETEPDIKFAGAALKGSAEAQSAILRAQGMGGGKNPQVEEQKETNSKLDDLIAVFKDFAGGVQTLEFTGGT